MSFENTKPSSADFFRKYSDLISEAEESNTDKKVDKDIKKLAKDQKKDVDSYKKDKDSKDDCSEDVKESTNFYKEMMGESHEGFAKVEKQVAKNPKVKDPGAVAASIGRKKYGKEKFQKMAAAGKKNESVSEAAARKKLSPERSKILPGSYYVVSNSGHIENGPYDLTTVKKALKRSEGCHAESGASLLKKKSVKENSAKLDEKWDKKVELNPAKKGMFKGKSKADLEKQEKNLVKSGPHAKGSAANTKEHELNFAIRAKGGWPKGKTESIEETHKSYTQKKKDEERSDNPMANKKKRPVKEAYGQSRTAGEYESSADFEDDSSKLHEALKAAMAILSSPQWIDWMKATDANYNPPRRVQSMNREIRQKLSEVQRIFDEMYNMMLDLG